MWTTRVSNGTRAKEMVECILGVSHFHHKCILFEKYIPYSSFILLCYYVLCAFNNKCMFFSTSNSYWHLGLKFWMAQRQWFVAYVESNGQRAWNTNWPHLSARESTWHRHQLKQNHPQQHVKQNKLKSKYTHIFTHTHTDTQTHTHLSDIYN